MASIHTNPCSAAELLTQPFFYPEDLITEILRGIRDTADAEEAPDPEPDGLVSSMEAAGLFHDIPTSVVAAVRAEDQAKENRGMTTALRMADGSLRVVPLQQNFRPSYKDEYTNIQLPSSWVQEAIREELQYFNDNVWVGVPIEDALGDREAKLISVRWVSCGKQRCE